MASDVVPNGIKIEWNMVQNGVPVVNRVYVTQTTTVGSGDLDDAVIAAKAFYDDFKTLQASSCVLQNITATDVSVANGTQTIVPYTTGNVGTASGVGEPANAAMCASLRTNFIGRSFRGRFYLGGLSSDFRQTAQTFTTTSVANLAGFITDFIDALNTINKTLVVVSRFASGVARITNLATEIVSVIVDNKIDSQRRRTAN